MIVHDMGSSERVLDSYSTTEDMSEPCLLQFGGSSEDGRRQVQAPKGPKASNSNKQNLTKATSRGGTWKLREASGMS